MEQAKFQPTYYTPEEYFALEARSEVRYEFFDGEIFAMAGASSAHNLLKGNLVAALRTGARERRCRVFDENMRLAVQEGLHYAYPDIMVTCHPADRRNTLTVNHPVLIVEVLSPGTADYDRTGKFRQYQKLPSLRHYLLVSQAQWSVEWYRRNEAGEWVYTVLNEAADVLEIPDLGLKVPLADIYDDTDVPFLRVVPPTATDVL